MVRQGGVLMVGLLLLAVLLALIFGAGTVLNVAANVLVIALVAALVIGLLGYAGLRGRAY
jgi:hypothetical protein